jgi:hypothetical protein
MTSKAATSAVNGALEVGRAPQTNISNSGSFDDFSLLSSTMTDPDSALLNGEAAAAKLEGLGIANGSVDPSFFSQTKRSSDDLVAASSTMGTPSPHMFRNDESPSMDDHGDRSPPATPSPHPRNRPDSTTPVAGKLDAPADTTPTGKSPLPDEPDSTKKTPSPYRIPKYKIALASNISSPARKQTSAS